MDRRTDRRRPSTLNAANLWWRAYYYKGFDVQEFYQRLIRCGLMSVSAVIGKNLLRGRGRGICDAVQLPIVALPCAYLCVSVRVFATQLSGAAPHGRLRQRSPLLHVLLQKAAGQPSEAMSRMQRSPAVSSGARGRRRTGPTAGALPVCAAFLRRRLPVGGPLRRDEGPHTSLSRPTYSSHRRH